jgi:hypothetical protein
MVSIFNPLDYSLLTHFPHRLHKKSGWIEHTPFAMFLIELLQPRIFVELGTQHGVSYCAFCEAVQELKLPTHCYAVDTWLGDAHATHYKESVYRDLLAHHRQYESFSTLLRMTFDQALPYVPDAAVDLLHIDGLHFYDAVKHDYETWRPKLSERAVILFHDTMELHNAFGVHQLWRELSPHFPNFNMEHGHGLGILAVGPHQQPQMLEFLNAANRKPAETRALFAALGRRVQLETEKLTESHQSRLARAVSAFKSKP